MWFTYIHIVEPTVACSNISREEGLHFIGFEETPFIVFVNNI